MMAQRSIVYFLYIAVVILLIKLGNQYSEYMNYHKNKQPMDHINHSQDIPILKKRIGTMSSNIIDENIYIEYERYVTTLQTQCEEIKRCGGRGDSGYDVCVDSGYKPKEHCLVYSFGSHYIFGFEVDVLKKFNCEIHTFDPSIPLAGNEHKIPNGVKFHLIGLSDTDYRNEFGWEMKSLSSIREYLNHSRTHIDILKLDIEGHEWKALPQIISSISSTDITQIVLEVHFGREKRSLKKDGYMKLKDNNWLSVDPYTQLNVLKQLKLYGFNIFSYQKNPRTKIQLLHSDVKGVITCYVLSMKNINIE